MREAWRRFVGHRLAVVGLGVIAILVVLAVVIVDGPGVFLCVLATGAVRLAQGQIGLAEIGRAHV